LCLSVASVANAGEVTVPVPEPMSMWLIASGVAGLGIRAYRKRRQ
jgi:hypothetical protein